MKKRGGRCLLFNIWAQGARNVPELISRLYKLKMLMEIKVQTSHLLIAFL